MTTYGPRLLPRGIASGNCKALVVLCLTLWRPASAQPPAQTEIGLWVDGTECLVGVVDGSACLDDLGADGLRPNRLVVTVFANGETAFPIDSDVFRQNLRYRTGKDPFAAFLREANKRGIEVFAAFELLQWVRPGASSTSDVFARHPELQEWNSQLGCKGVEVGKFASPFSPEVRALLTELVEGFAHRYPTIAGIVVDCRLSTGELLGYSETARVACIRAKQMDPVDIRLGSSDEDMQSRARDWYHWKRDEISRLVGKVVRAYRAASPSGRVLAVGSANFYRQKLGIRNLTCQDWLHWMVEGYVDEVLLDEAWSDPKNENLWAGARALVGKAERQVPLTPVVRPEAGLEAEFRALGRHNLAQVIVRSPMATEASAALKRATSALVGSRPLP